MSLLQKLSAAGVQMSKSLTKLWSSPEMVIEGLKAKDVEVYQKTFKEINESGVEETRTSVFAILRDGDMSRLVGFAPDQIDLANCKIDKHTGEVTLPKKTTLSIGIVTALRDDESLRVRDLDDEVVPVEEGVQTIRAYVEGE